MTHHLKNKAPICSEHVWESLMGRTSQNVVLLQANGAVSFGGYYLTMIQESTKWLITSLPSATKGTVYSAFLGRSWGSNIGAITRDGSPAKVISIPLRWEDRTSSSIALATVLAGFLRFIMKSTLSKKKWVTKSVPRRKFLAIADNNTMEKDTIEFHTVRYCH